MREPLLLLPTRLPASSLTLCSHFSTPLLQAILTGLKLSGRLESSKGGQQLWGAWQKLLGLAGLAGVPQVLWATFQPHSTSLLPCQATLAAGCAAVALEAAGLLPLRLRGLWAATSAWTATALFMLQPVSQLVNNFTVGGLLLLLLLPLPSTARPAWRWLLCCWLPLRLPCLRRLLGLVCTLPPSLLAPAPTLILLPCPCSLLFLPPVQDPASLQGLSLATILLAAGGNALMVPRALWTRDWVWLSGCMWGSLLFGWAQMLRCVAASTGHQRKKTPARAAPDSQLLGCGVVLSVKRLLACKPSCPTGNWTAHTLQPSLPCPSLPSVLQHVPGPLACHGPALPQRTPVPGRHRPAVGLVCRHLLPLCPRAAQAGGGMRQA